MAHQRNQSGVEGLKTPHTVSLKVLRLSRPSLAQQYPLPSSQELGISESASLAYPSDHANDTFIISPVLNLPEAFGSAYVGETFSCTLCANNELEPSDTTRTISGVKIQGDMQTPSTPAGSPLELSGPEDEDETQASPGPGQSLQKILRFELKEEGNHVLAVTVTYTETALAGEGKAASGRVRTFRKLYQFVAQQLLSVRTKAGELTAKDGMSRFLLEAQLENMGEGTVSFEVCCFSPICVPLSRAPFAYIHLSQTPEGTIATSGFLPSRQPVFRASGGGKPSRGSQPRSDLDPAAKRPRKPLRRLHMTSLACISTTKLLREKSSMLTRPKTDGQCQLETTVQIDVAKLGHALSRHGAT
ncbi:hypothetical protein K491DRAFT_662126, partial [Lophiostoma macrostomum CBS 122681]